MVFLLSAHPHQVPDGMASLGSRPVSFVQKNDCGSGRSASAMKRRCFCPPDVSKKCIAFLFQTQLDQQCFPIAAWDRRNCTDRAPPILSSVPAGSIAAAASRNSGAASGLRVEGRCPERAAIHRRDGRRPSRHSMVVVLPAPLADHAEDLTFVYFEEMSSTATIVP